MSRKNKPRHYTDPILCNGKRRYNSEAEALRIAHEQELLHFGQDLTLSIYRCHLCGGWHLTRHKK